MNDSLVFSFLRRRLREEGWFFFFSFLPSCMTARMGEFDFPPSSSSRAGYCASSPLCGFFRGEEDAFFYCLFVKDVILFFFFSLLNEASRFSLLFPPYDERR